MIAWPLRSRHTPIGVDIGTHSVKLVQLSADHQRLVESVRWDLPTNNDNVSPAARLHTVGEALAQAQQHRKFRGRDAVVCLGRGDLFLQNLRVPKAEGADLTRLVHQEAAGRLPFSVSEAEIRFLEAADVRQGDATLREVIVMACHRPALAGL
ncbi:MAG: pilus assembly protein PilM, partial [Planctomycetales bacterium]|nr:pilus assembly protein PilM [Planctomycetales bacterium]